MSHLHLWATGLTFRYPAAATAVLSGADIVVPPGGRLALLGANGSGKTTLLRCLSGALRPDAGQVLLDGRPLRHTRAGLRAHRQAVQLVLQDPDDQLFSASVRQDVSFGPTNLRLPPAEVDDRVAEALRLLAVTHLADRPTHQLSYGERKRVAVAGAMAMRPCVLLLDEPTAGLDPAGVQEVMAALRRLQDDGTSLVLSTHDVDLALRWADEVAVVVGGTVVQGRPHAVLADAQLLGRARLQTPWVLAVADRLVAAGVLRPETAVRARELDDLLPLLPEAS